MAIKDSVILNIDLFIKEIRAALEPHGLTDAQVNAIIVKLVNALPHG